MDIDLKNPLLYQIDVDSAGECGFVNVEYENITNFCTTCSLIGHLAMHCKLNQAKEDKDVQANLVKLAGKRSVFKDDSDDDDLDKGNLEKKGANGSVKPLVRRNVMMVHIVGEL